MLFLNLFNPAESLPGDAARFLGRQTGGDGVLLGQLQMGKQFALQFAIETTLPEESQQCSGHTAQGHDEASRKRATRAVAFSQFATSTRSSASFLAVKGLGEIRAGAPAELVIYREDPTRDLAALSSIVGVVRDGRLYPRADLDAQLALYRTHFEGFAHRVVITHAMRFAFGRLLPLLFASDPQAETESTP